MRLISGRRRAGPDLTTGQLRRVIVVGGSGDQQNLADRLGSMFTKMIIDELDHHFDRRSSIRLGQGRSGSQS